MYLYFLRHGLAGQHGDPRYPDDSLRPLTLQGREKMRSVSLGMKNLKLTFDTILSSPYVRARQTAEIVAQIYKLKNKKIHLTNNLLPPASVKRLLQEIKESFPKSKNILLVGHEPHLTEMISCLLKCRDPLAIDLKKGGLCSLTIAKPQGPANAIFNWLLNPTQLSLISSS